MQKRIHSLILVAALILPFVPVADARVYTYWGQPDISTTGVHPWEGRSRTTISGSPRSRPPYWTDLYFYQHPDYSKTHALHPYHREGYYDPPLNSDEYRYTYAYHPNTKFRIEDAYVPQPAALAECQNYSYARPNYRVPPYQYQCQR